MLSPRDLNLHTTLLLRKRVCVRHGESASAWAMVKPNLLYSAFEVRIYCVPRDGKIDPSIDPAGVRNKTSTLGGARRNLAVITSVTSSCAVSMAKNTWQHLSHLQLCSCLDDERHHDSKRQESSSNQLYARNLERQRIFTVF